MAQNNSPIIKFSSTELKDIKSFCKLNELDINEFVKSCFDQGYNIEKYGLINSEGVKVIEREVVKEVIKEVKVEVPVEVIVEKEIIKEVPIEVTKEVEKEVIVEIVKEVPVDTIKEVKGEVDSEKLKGLQNTIQKLREQLREKEQSISHYEKIISDLDKQFKDQRVTFLGSTNLNNELKNRKL